MARFLLGDEQGYIKSLAYTTAPLEDGNKCMLKVLSHRTSGEQKLSVQRMISSPKLGGPPAVVAGYSDGTVTVSTFSLEGSLQAVKEWKDARLKNVHSYIGLAASDNKIYSCSTNGALQITTVQDLSPDSTPTHYRTLLPTRLCSWQLSPDSTTFAYGGEEVELSVWNTEAAFQPRPEGVNTSPEAPRKRKRKNELFPGEIWRAKNTPNDALDLRQPVRITSIDYLPSNSSAQHIVTGTQLGDVRRYDTRAARRPVADWKHIGKVGGIQVVKKGLSDHELFVSDNGTNLFLLDLRNGRTIFGYKGLSGAVTSIAPSPTIMVSTANDRYARIHSTFPPNAKEGQNLDRKGEVLEKAYLVSIPTVVIWDDGAEAPDIQRPLDETNEDEVWDEMRKVGNSGTETEPKRQRHRYISQP